MDGGCVISFFSFNELDECLGFFWTLQQFKYMLHRLTGYPKAGGFKLAATAAPKLIFFRPSP